MKICPAVAELFHACRQTECQAEKTELIIAFSNFANTPKTALEIKIINTFRNVSIYNKIWCMRSIINCTCATLQLHTLWLPGNMNVNMTFISKQDRTWPSCSTVCTVDRYFRSPVLLHLLERYWLRIPASAPPVLNETVWGFFQSLYENTLWVKTVET
jgi:hypothetical protein